MKILGQSVFILFLVSLTGCFATKKRCLRLFPPISSVDTVVFETVRDSVVLKDTTIFVSIPGETIFDSIYINGKEYSDTVILETDYAKTTAFYITPYVNVTLEQKDIVLNVKLDSVIKEMYYWKQKYIKIMESDVVTITHTPVIYQIALWAWIGVFILILFLYLLSRFRIFR